MAEISIIVPVYNVEKYLCQCIDSLISQTFKDIEIILVDDGSPDNCPKICDDYIIKDSRIRVIHKKNRGLSAARNTGLDVARGKYICFVDSDDYVSLDYCETLYTLIKATDYDFSVCGVCRFNDGDIPKPNLNDNVSTLSNFEFLAEQLNKKSEFGVWNKLYKKEIFDKIRFANEKIHEDVIWSADLAGSLTNGVIETQKQCLFYRQRDNSIVSNGKDKCSPDFIYAANHLIDVVSKKYPQLLDLSLHYACNYPWFFVDKIYLNKSFKENKQLLISIQQLIRQYRVEYKNLESYSKNKRHRMMLFSRSKFLYGFNVYARLLRVYFYSLLKKDAYKSGHRI